MLKATLKRFRNTEIGVKIFSQYNTPVGFTRIIFMYFVRIILMAPQSLLLYISRHDVLVVIASIDMYLDDAVTGSQQYFGKPYCRLLNFFAGKGLRLCIGMYTDRHVYEHVYRHACRHVYGHVDRNCGRQRLSDWAAWLGAITAAAGVCIGMCAARAGVCIGDVFRNV